MSQDDDPNVILTFSVPRSLKARIEALAEAEDRPVSNFLRVQLTKIAEERDVESAKPQEVGA